MLESARLSHLFATAIELPLRARTYSLQTTQEGSGFKRASRSLVDANYCSNKLRDYRLLRLSPPSDEFPSEAAINNLNFAIRDSQAIVTHDELPIIVGVESQVVQIFQNLIGNAIKYRGDRIPQVHVSAASRNREWVFSVADNGIGIDPKYFERIFVIFQRLHGREAYQGTGIGLAICKRILQQQGGRIWVESEPAKGSVFHFSLPQR